MNTELTMGVTIFIAAFAWFTCVSWYTIRARFWKTAYGINTWLVSFTITIALLRLCGLVLYDDFAQWGGSYWIGLLTYFLLAIGGFQRLYLIDKAQREGEAQEKQEKQAVQDKQLVQPFITQK